MGKKILKHLKEELAHAEYYNLMAPFPVFDTEYVAHLKKQIKKMETRDYDEDPVYACKYCKNLVVPKCYEVDEDGNETCLRCGSVNETQEYKTIDEYLKATRKQDE